LLAHLHCDESAVKAVHPAYGETGVGGKVE